MAGSDDLGRSSSMKCALITAVVLATTATPVLAEDWHVYSRTATRAYLADVDSIATVDGVTTIRTASVPTTSPAGDLTHSEAVYQFECAAAKWRMTVTSEYEADGTHEEYPEEGVEWDSVRPDTVPDFVKQVACEDSRSSGTTFPSIQAFTEAGRS
jgi:hypothetical protein